MKSKVALLIACMCLFQNVKAQEQLSDKTPTVYLVSNAHLDTQWNWDIQKTIKNYVWNTLNQNLFLLEKYPHYIFNFEGGVKYAWMKEYYPLHYELMKKYIQSGRWHISGASWDATDTLVPSVESAIRNILLGQTFYRNEFGTESTDIFLPDCFGFGWTLPTVASHCGLIGFSSQKLQWRQKPFYDGKYKYPFSVGLWKGIDGAAIMMTHGWDYNKKWNYENLAYNKELIELTSSSPLHTVSRYYGTGDVGGSPTMESVQAVEHSVCNSGSVKVISATSDQIFKDFMPYSKHPELPEYNGELLMDVHGTGCYTSQAAMKLYNRQNEMLGDAAERASVVAEWLNRINYPKSMLTNVWKRVLFHQFHDDLTGTSIPRAYEFSWNDELLSLGQFANVMTSSMGAVANLLDTKVKGVPVVLYNPLGYTVTDVVELKLPCEKTPRAVAVFDSSNRQVLSQILSESNGKVSILIEATVPAVGYAVYNVCMYGTSGNVAVTDNSAREIENSCYRLSFDEYGDVESLYDKINNKELVKAGKRIRLALFTTNESFVWPAWEIKKETLDKEPVSIMEDVQIKVVEDGKLRKTVCVEKKKGESIFRQYIRLYEGALAHRIDFYNEVYWATSNALLKAEFPLNVSNPEASYDLGLGSVKRGNNTDIAYEVYAQQWADLTDKDGSYGITVMNDCKYGWDKPDDNTLRLSLIHTPKTEKRYSYQNKQDMGFHTFVYSIFPHVGELNHAQVVQQAEILNQKVKAVTTDKHKGCLGRNFSFVSSDNDNVVIKSVKKAEDSDDYIVRVYEIGGKEAQNAIIGFAGAIREAYEADGTEKVIGSAKYKENNLMVSINPFSVKTFKVKLAPSSQERSKTQFMELPLSYNAKVFSYNQFRKEADFESGYSYAAEMLPDSLVAGQVPFRLGDKDRLNGMRCMGDTLHFPKDKKVNRIYLLAASANDCVASFNFGKCQKTLTVPSYTGFVGQWGHKDHTQGFLKQAEVAYVGTHRHSPSEDCPYEFTYMFKFGLDVPSDASYVVLPNNKELVLFAVTCSSESGFDVVPVSKFYRTSIQNE